MFKIDLVFISLTSRAIANSLIFILLLPIVHRIVVNIKYLPTFTLRAFLYSSFQVHNHMSASYDAANDIRYKLATKSSLMFFILIVFATIVRPIFADLPIILTVFGAINSFIVGMLLLLFKYSKPREAYLPLLVASGYFCLMPLLLFSGGVNSQFAVLLPIIPIIACLLVGLKALKIAAAFNIAVILTMRIFNAEIQSTDVFEHPIDLINARTFWLCLGSLLSLYFALQFGKLSEVLSKRLSYQANIDGLTGILNRRSLIERTSFALSSLAAEQKYISVLMIDVDHFKNLNDQYGHLFGDECLQRVAQCLQDASREEVDIVGRYGGEEFLVVLHNVNQEQAKIRAQQIRLSIEQSAFTIKNKTVHISVTIGVCSAMASQVNDIKDIIDSADKALYEGKKASRNCVISVAL